MTERQREFENARRLRNGSAEAVKRRGNFWGNVKSYVSGAGEGLIDTASGVVQMLAARPRAASSLGIPVMAPPDVVAANDEASALGQEMIGRAAEKATNVLFPQVHGYTPEEEETLGKYRAAGVATGLALNPVHAAKLTTATGRAAASAGKVAGMAVARGAYRGAQLGAEGLARGLGKIDPQFVKGGKGLAAADANVRNGVYIGRDAALRAGDEADIVNLRKYNEMTRQGWDNLSHDQRLAVFNHTSGWQQVPTGEVVKQIPSFDFNPKFWGSYEPFATKFRSDLMKFAGKTIDDVVPKSAVPIQVGGGTYMGGRLKDALTGPGMDELLKYYPEAGDWGIAVGRIRDGSLGVASGKNFVIGDRAISRGVKEIKNTLHHEPEHIIQDTSNMAPGGSSDAARYRLAADLSEDINTGKTASFKRGYPGLSGPVEDNVKRKENAFIQAAVARNNIISSGRHSEDAANAFADHKIYKHYGGEAGAFAVGETSTNGSSPGLLEDTMRAIGIDTDAVFDYTKSPAQVGFRRAGINSQRVQVDNAYKKLMDEKKALTGTDAWSPSPAQPRQSPDKWTAPGWTPDWISGRQDAKGGTTIPLPYSRWKTETSGDRLGYADYLIGFTSGR